MNHNNFMKWINRQLLPNLPPHCCLVIDNASYHNVAVVKDPTSATRKKDMVNWLRDRNIAYDASSTKPELYNLIKQYKGKCVQYVLDTELRKHGHCVLRLPPYHPELNPIEKIWALMKNWVAARNITFKINDIIELAEQKFSRVSPEDWSNVCSHVDAVVQQYIQKENLLDSASDDFVFTVNTPDSDDDDSDLFSDDEDDAGVTLIDWE